MSKGTFNDLMNSESYKRYAAEIEEERKTIKYGPNVIHLAHLGDFSHQDLLELEAKLKSIELEFSSYNKSKEIAMSLDDYSLVEYITLSYPIWKNLVSGILPNAAWDLIKSIIFRCLQ